MNELHFAAASSAEEMEAVLSTAIDINQRDRRGGNTTPLMIAALNGNARTVKILLEKGADAEILSDHGYAALHFAAEQGHVDVSKMLVKVTNLEEFTGAGATALHLAAGEGHCGVIRVLIGAGAHLNGKMICGHTPLYLAAENGHVQALRELLRAKADPLLGVEEWERLVRCITYSPLDAASRNGHLSVVRELIQQVGIEGCCGATAGLNALEAAAKGQHLDIMAELMDAGVGDSGAALAGASKEGKERAAQLLLQRPSDQTAGGSSYADSKHDDCGYTPLFLSIESCRPCASRIVRMLIEAGADTSAAVPITSAPGGPPWFNDTPLAYALDCLREGQIGGEDVTEEQLQSLQGIRRLLMRVEAVHAVSWLWRNDAPGMRGAPETARKAQPAATAGTQLGMMLPLMRRRARRRGMSPAAMFRWGVGM